MPGARDPAGDATSRWKVVTETLAGLAGVVLLLYVLGGLTLAARLHALKLPVSEGLSVLPTSVLVVEGIRASLLGTVLGLAVLGFLYLTRRRPERHAVILVSAGVIYFTFVGAALVAGQTHWEWLITLAIGLGAALAVVAILHVGVPTWRRAGVLWSVIALFGYVLALGTEFVPPTHLNFVNVRLKDGGETDGYYLASDSSSLFLVPSVLNRTVGVVSAIPRSEVKAFTVERLISRERVEGPPMATGPSHKYADLFDYLKAIKLDPGWERPPVIPFDSAAYLLDKRHYLEFAPSRAHPLTDPGQRVPLADVLADPEVFIATPVIATGVVSRLANRPGVSHERVVVLRPERPAHTEAYCYYIPQGHDDPSRGARVRVRAVVVAWGTFGTRSGRATDRVALACSYVTSQALTVTRPRRDDGDDRD